MTKEIDSLYGTFIGIVVGIDRTTREIQAYIPKLMPKIEKNSKPYTIKTNLSNKEVSIKTNNNIQILPYIIVKPFYYEAPMPVIGSKVFIEFIDEDFNIGYWKEFNMNGDYDVIEEEKYEDIFSLSVGDKINQIKKLDNIQILFEDGRKVILTEENKQKVFKILRDAELEKQLEEIERNIRELTTLKNEIQDNLADIRSFIGFNKKLFTEVETTFINKEYFVKTEDETAVSGKKYYKLENNQYKEALSSNFNSSYLELNKNINFYIFSSNKFILLTNDELLQKVLNIDIEDIEDIYSTFSVSVGIKYYIQTSAGFYYTDIEEFNPNTKYYITDATNLSTQIESLENRVYNLENH